MPESPFKNNKKSPLTKLGFEKLATEHENLRSNVRPRVVSAIADAAAEGDRSENAEYIYCLLYTSPSPRDS